MLLDRVTKEKTDITRIELDLSPWLDPGETITKLVSSSITLGTTGWSEAPYPPPGSPPPYDPTPLGLQSQAVISTGLTVFVNFGTPGNVYTYQAVVDGTSGRRVTVEAGVQVSGIPPVRPVPPPPPPPQQAFPPMLLPGQDGLFVPVTNPLTGLPGMATFPYYDIYQSPDSYALRGPMTIRSQPYGYYDTGALLSLVCTWAPFSWTRAGINGGFEQGVPAIAAYGGFDLVNLYVAVAPQSPQLVLHGATYDATHVFPHPPLTPDEIKILRFNMWVLTNSIDTRVNPAPRVPNGSKPVIHYGSFITGWAENGTSITVVGWTVPGGGHAEAGQVPSSVYDPGAPGPIAYVSVQTGVFGSNFVLQHDQLDTPDNQVRTYQGIEFDFQNYGVVDYEMVCCGLSMDYSSVHGVQAAQDSYGFLMSGMPTSFMANYTGVGLNIAADTAMLSNVFNVYHWWSVQPWNGTPNIILLWETQGYADSNLLRLQCWNSRDNGNPGWQSTSMHLGFKVDSTPMSEIVFNGAGNQGWIQLRTAGGVNGLTMDSSGNITFAGEILGSSAAYIETVYAQKTAATGGFVGSIQSAGTSPGIMGFWNHDLSFHIGQGAGDIPGDAISDLFNLNAGGNLGISGATATKPGGGAWTAPSDLRIKDVLGDYNAGLAAIIALHPVRYKLKNNLGYPGDRARQPPQDAEFVGLVAQQVETVMPEMVGRIRAEIDGVSVHDLRTMDLTALPLALVNAIKELAERVIKLENDMMIRRS